MPVPALAVPTIKLSVNGGGTFLAPTTHLPGALSTTDIFVDANGTTFTVTATSNAPLGTPQAQLSQVQLSINGGSAADLVNLVVAASDVTYTAPSGSSTVTSSFSGSTAAAPVTGSGTFVSFIDYNNNLFGGLPIGGVVSGNTDSTPTQNVTISSSFNNTVVKGTTASIPFALSNEFHIANLSIGVGAQLSLTGSTTLAAVPAPAGIVLALTGLPCLGIGTWFRRRKAKVT